MYFSTRFFLKAELSVLPLPCGADSPSLLMLNAITDFPVITTSKLKGLTTHRHIPLCHPFESLFAHFGNGISTVCTSGYSNCVPLRSDLPEDDERCFGNLAHSAMVILTPQRYSYRHSHSRPLQSPLQGNLHCCRDAPLPHALRHISIFGVLLEPR